MPHEAPWLDDYEARKKASLQKQNSRVLEVQRLQNAIMKALLKCPTFMADPSKMTRGYCETQCGNEECFRIWKERERILWPEMKEQETPVLAANTVNMDLKVESLKLDAKSQKSQELKKSRHHSQGVSGMHKKSRSLFDLEAA